MILLIALGVLFLLHQAGLVNAGDFLEGIWPKVIFIVGLLPFWTVPTRPGAPGIIIVVGLALLWIIHVLIPDSALAFLWPLALIVVGAWQLKILMNRWRLNPE